MAFIRMAKHFVAVCVVCLLCADHLPCKTHFEELGTTGTDQYKGNNAYIHGTPLPADKFTKYVGNDILSIVDKGGEHIVQSHTRRKRHSVHSHAGGEEDSHGLEMNENSRQHIEKIFNKFGNGQDKTMDLDGFESMLEYLGLTKLVTHQEEEKRQHGTGAPHLENDNNSVSRRVFGWNSLSTY